MIFSKSNTDNIEEFIAASHSTGAAILIDKPVDWTSFNVVAKIRNLLKVKKVGHAGTLDPLATGLLIICTGKFTKKINEFQDLYKEYTGEIKIGAVTKSYDSEFPEENIKDISHISDEMVIESSRSFIGRHKQFPPMFSAKKVNGKKLYELARKDIKIELKANEVDFFNVIAKYEPPLVDFYIKCSKGTYIRSFAYDLGEKLGVGGYLKSLRRTAIGDFRADDAIKMNDFIDIISNYSGK
ncbi:MAG: tRNA pseudouridine(55) synthase TruB [Candidatus Kapabacteria bacterium]|nr:tRNA pseudouridine(55) synthase TruB [Ignavibacteriota bacterium]MCW5884413.1 tRNA pseudouridine(55) synthase TruB [Candidatus Kapabacteria bacterium]